MERGWQRACFQSARVLGACTPLPSAKTKLEAAAVRGVKDSAALFFSTGQSGTE
ncbi:hypothetical protein [Paenibacillus dendritiformis]|uniref:hypothetical protein n=1 Tax=Paenibacillus dendritiformis TaxID=130049 RepID=UPI0020C5A196|nr:hypothetical protein [Paenibacillus dendritiformis]CAH8768896.1 hypothetical protein H7S4_001594 [Paenibacillus dendritiformis]